MPSSASDNTHATGMDSRSEAPPLVCVIDDDPVLVDYLCQLLQRTGLDVAGYQLPGAFLDSGLSALAQRPSVVICDLRMPGLDGLQVCRALRAAGYFDPVILMSAHLDISIAVDAMQQGFFDVVEKPIDTDALLARVTHALRSSRRAWRDRHWFEQRRERLALLTQREHEVLDELSYGRMNKTVADHLQLSVKTIETHRQHIMDKLGLASAADLLRFAVEWRVRTHARPGHPPSSRTDATSRLLATDHPGRVPVS